MKYRMFLKVEMKRFELLSGDPRVTNDAIAPHLRVARGNFEIPA